MLQLLDKATKEIDILNQNLGKAVVKVESDKPISSNQKIELDKQIVPFLNSSNDFHDIISGFIYSFSKKSSLYSITVTAEVIEDNEQELEKIDLRQLDLAKATKDISTLNQSLEKTLDEIDKEDSIFFNQEIEFSKQPIPFLNSNFNLSGRAGVLLLLSPLRTERAGFQALGSSDITFRNEFCGDSINVARLGCPWCLYHLYFWV